MSIQEDLRTEILSNYSLVLIASPQENLTASEVLLPPAMTNQKFEALKEYLGNGGSVFYLSGDGDSNNMNYLLEDFGMAVSSDKIIKTYYTPKYPSPSSVLVTDGIVNREIQRAANHLTTSRYESAL